MMRLSFRLRPAQRTH